MIGSIVWKEARARVRDGRLWVLGLGLALLFLLMLASATQQQAHSERERVEVEAVSRDQWDHQGNKNPHRAAHFGLYAFKPRSALASLEPGVDPLAGQALWLEPHKRNMAMHAPAADKAPSLGLGGFTPAFALLALVPLLILVLGHDVVSQERETGTLRMLHACGMRARPMVLGKWLGLCAGVTTVMAPALIVGGWLVVDRSSAVSASLLLICLLLYYGLRSAITVLVSLHGRSSRSALLTLLAAWVGIIFVIPRLGASVVEQAHPLPDVEAFWSAIHQDIEHGLPGDGNAAQRLKVFDAQLLADNKVSRLEDLPFGANAKRRLFRDGYATRVHALHFDRLWDAQLDQQREWRWWTAMSPFASMRAVTSALAGTDLRHRRHFEDAAEQYRQRFTTAMDEWDLQATHGVTSFESRYAGDAQWQAIPRWSYVSPSAGDALRASSADLGLLAGWLLAAFAALWIGARRLNP